MARIVVLLIILAVIPLSGQNSKKDSLVMQLKLAKNDTLIINSHSKLANYYTNEENNLDSALIHYKKAHALSSGVSDKKYAWRSLYDIATTFTNLGELDSSLHYYELGLKKAHNKQSEMETYAGLGNVYFLKGEFIRAYEYFLKQLRTAEKIGTEKSMARAHGNVGVILKEQKKYDEALPHFVKSAELNTKIGEEKGVLIAYVNTGNVLYEKAKLSKDHNTKLKALEMYQRAKPVAKYAEKSYNMRIATVLLHTNLGNIYSDLKDYKQAVNAYRDATALIEKYGYLPQSALVYTNLAALYVDMHDVKNAEITLKQARTAVEHLGGYDNYEQLYHVLSRYYDLKGDYKNAYLSHLEYKKYSDSLFNSDNSEKRKELELNYEFEKREAAAKAEQDKKQAIADVEKKRQRLILYSVFAGFSLMVLLSVFIYRGYRNKKKVNEIITRQKDEVEKAKLIIERQKDLVEEKQKEILDSIHYAKRIQDALFSGETLLEKYFSGKEKFFIYFNPKDIVSGDFYWATEHGDYFYLAACDSTGHGVPGAFMSLLNIGFMSEAINEHNILEPNLVFDYVRNRLVSSISKEGQKDGFDGILLRTDRNSGEMCYAAAHNKPLLVANGEYKELACDKMPVGKGEKTEPFNLYHITERNATLYLFTDGFADQFGGEKGKKFKYKPLYELLVSNAQLNPELQKEKLDLAFKGWKKDLEQVDDVLVMGIKI